MCCGFGECDRANAQPAPAVETCARCGNIADHVWHVGGCADNGKNDHPFQPAAARPLAEVERAARHLLDICTPAWVDTYGPHILDEPLARLRAAVESRDGE